MKKPFPKFDSDEELETFLDMADLDEYDLTAGALPRDEWFQRYERFVKDASIHLRLPAGPARRRPGAGGERESADAKAHSGIYRARVADGSRRAEARGSRKGAIVQRRRSMSPTVRSVRGAFTASSHG